MSLGPRPSRPLRAVLPFLALLVVPFFAPALASADPPDPLASGPFGVNRAYYNAGTLQLTVPVSGSSATTPVVDCTGSAATTSGFQQYGQSSRCPGMTFPQPLEGTVTWPAGDPDPYKVILFLHGRHTACKTSTGTDGSGQVFGTGACTNGFWPSWEGYDYISNLMASWGYTVISPSAGALVTYDNAGGSVGTPLDAGAFARAQIIGASLDLMHDWNEVPGPAGIGSALVGKLDFSSVGIMGHSRGGEGVNEFIPFNRQRPAGRRYNLTAVFSLAPIDRNKQTPVGTNFATLLPACDGDVTTLAGANAYERGKYAVPDDPFAKLQYYMEGTNHNFYNTRWVSSDRTGSDVACGSTPSTRIRLVEADQRKNGLAAIPTFLRYYAGHEEDLAPWMDGTAGMHGYPASACPTGATHVPDCEDEMKLSYLAPAGDRLDVVRPSAASQPTAAVPSAPDEAGGAYFGTGFAFFDWCNPDPFATVLANPPLTQSTAPLKACPGPTRSSVSATSAIQSFGPQLTLAWDGPATMTAELRGDSRDVSSYDSVNFRASFQSNDTTRNPLGNGYTPRQATQNFHVALIDRDGEEKSVALKDVYSGGLQSALGTAPNNTLHVILQGFRIPLSLYEGDVDLSRLDRIELRFGDTPDVNATGAIELADLGFQRDAANSPLPRSVPLRPLPTDPALPPFDGVPTDLTYKRPRVDRAAVCGDGAAPAVAVRKVRLSKKRGLVSGWARDLGCSASGVARVQVAVGKVLGRDRCRFLEGGRLSPANTCAVPLSRIATGTKHWRLKLGKKLPPGRYSLMVQAMDRSGNLSSRKFKTVRVSK